MKILAVASQKGGVAKTTTTINLAAILAQKGARVLACDNDPQHNLTFSAGFRAAHYEMSMDSIYAGKLSGKAAPSIQDMVLRHDEGFDLIPSNMKLADAALAIATRNGWQSVLSEYFAGNRDSPYDVVLIDCPPELSALTVNAMCAADSVIIPMQADGLSLEGLKQILNTMRGIKAQINPKLEVEGILLAKYSGRSLFTRTVAEQIRSEIGRQYPVYALHIPNSDDVVKSNSLGTSILKVNPYGSVAKGYKGMANEFLSKNKGLVRPPEKSAMQQENML